ncbi:sterol uptake control 2 [Phialemonium atrogriseum]|uniref:Sterol uptake control 2 n=1 Tax=Phialemonium atrogriseum TaxID=1093897 RepID=A0AAJ0BRK3_9PEZI|nr:sterol uptake control 2 [Phialemonium atrogriseum]KAK1761722.1 sterol uptake control 2 [Phialemonium atrogriseum]
MSPEPVRKGRVRTGCLTCRSRKVKCDETRPICHNCTRLNRACFYEASPLDFSLISRGLNNEHTALEKSVSVWAEGQFDNIDPVTITNVATSSHYVTGDGSLVVPESSSTNIDDASIDFNFMTGEWGDLFPAGTNESCGLGPSPQWALGDAVIQNHDISEDQESPFSYFLSSVEPPFITPWDSMNWARMKVHISRLGALNPAVLAAVVAVETLYKTLVDDGDSADALPEYFAAKGAYLSLLKDEGADTELILVATFLLCCFEVVAQQETVSGTLKQKDILVTRLEQRSKSQPWSPIVRRIVSWLRLFHTKAMHLGGRGMLSPKLSELLLQAEQQPPPSLASMCLDQPTAALAAVDSLQQSLFQFYCELQHISTRVSALNRHHRPRGTPADEMKVDDISKDIDQRLKYLWEGRPCLLEVATPDISHAAAENSANDLSHLAFVARLCKISYNAEIIYHARGHGRSHSQSPTTVAAKGEIRKLIDAREACPEGTSLHPAFIWPLFLYSVESSTQDEVRWALDKLELVSNPLWNTTTIKAFIRELTEEQFRKGERVDSRYFCVERFGIVPPFM